MLRSALTAILCLTAFAMTTAAQDGRTAFPFHRDLFPVSSVELVTGENGPELVIAGELPDSCSPEPIVNTELVGAAYFVDLYRDIPFNRECAAVMTPYEQRVDASPLLTMTDDLPGVLIVVINGQLYGVDYPIDNGTASPALNQLYVRGALPYNEVSIRHTMEGDMEITLTGTLSDSCPIPVYRAVEDYQNPGFVTVEAYTAINIAALCAEMMSPFEAVMRSPVFDSVAINGLSVPFLPELSVDTQKFVKQTALVESATAEWVEGLLPNIKVTVTGTTDGCDYPIQMVSAAGEDNTYYVTVARIIPQNVSCTLEAVSFTQELYIAPDLSVTPSVTIYVNDKLLSFDQKSR